MADTKVTGLTENTTPAATDIIYIVDDPGGTPASQKVTLANIKALVNDITTDAEWDAKGDIVAGTGANTADRLAVGANNTVLMADSGEATGLKWSASPIAVDTVWDAKGDLVAGTGANTAARLAVGANGTVLTAASGETTGLSWAAPTGGVETYAVCNGRLTLTTAVPVTTADVSAAATLYFTPYKGSQIGLYDGSTGWDILTFTELSLDISGYTASKPYDIWVYNNSGTATLDSTVWTNATTRATALTTQDGIYVKTGATTRRYVGTIYINSSGGQTDDAYLTRHVWNYYNRAYRPFNYENYDGSHTYTSATWRAWNNSTAVRVSCVVGVSEEPVQLVVRATINVSAAGGVAAYVTLALDDTDDGGYISSTAIGNRNLEILQFGAYGYNSPGVGYHFYQGIEQGGTTASFGFMHITGYILG